MMDFGAGLTTTPSKTVDPDCLFAGSSQGSAAPGQTTAARYACHPTSGVIVMAGCRVTQRSTTTRLIRRVMAKATTRVRARSRRRIEAFLYRALSSTVIQTRDCRAKVDSTTRCAPACGWLAWSMWAGDRRRSADSWDGAARRFGKIQGFRQAKDQHAEHWDRT
jgi:hypothetical protein